jgi:hypothetical protein
MCKIIIIVCHESTLRTLNTSLKYISYKVAQWLTMIDTIFTFQSTVHCQALLAYDYRHYLFFFSFFLLCFQEYKTQLYHNNNKQWPERCLGLIKQKLLYWWTFYHIEYERQNVVQLERQKMFGILSKFLSLFYLI